MVPNFLGHPVQIPATQNSAEYPVQWQARVPHASVQHKN